MTEGRIKRTNKSGRILAATVLVLSAFAGLPAHGTPATAPTAPQIGTWEQQAPYPSRFAINGVDMVTATEAWVVAYTDILHTTDGGATWENQPRPGSENLYAVDFFDSLHGIAMGNTTLYTTNGGATWNQSNVFGEDVEMADANLAFITDHRVAGYYRSTNGGATWTFLTMPSNITSIQCFDSLNCVAASPSGVYHSDDGGLNWSFIAGQGETFASTCFINHNQGWIVLGNSARRTTDGGTTWQVQTLPPGSWIYSMMFADANNGWAVGDNVVRTTNGGTTWQEVPLSQDSLPLWDVSFADAQHGIAGGDSFLNTDSVIITSTDGGASWDTRTNGSINDVLDMAATDLDHAWASYDYGGKIGRTTDGGLTWRLAEVGEQYVVLSGIDMTDNLHGWAVGYETTFLNGRIYHTTDGGATWQQQFDSGASLLEAVDALNDQTAIIVGGYSGSGSIRHRTTDGGNTWHSLNVPIGAFFYDVFFLDDKTGWMVGGNGDIVKTTDGGDTWVVQTNPALYTLASVHFSDPNNGWAGGYFGTLVRTTNGGTSWSLQDPQIPEFTHVLAVNSTSPTRGWIAGYGGGAQSLPYVKYTTDGGATWIEDTPQVGPYDSFSALAFLDDQNGWAAGAGGIFRHSGPTCPTITVSPSTLPNGTVGTAYSELLTASGGTPPYTFAVTSGTMPSGLLLDAASGVISGTPTLQGTFSFTVAATDSTGCSGAQGYTVDISEPTCPTITVSPSTLPNGTAGAAYNQTLTASGGTPAYTFGVTSGTLPSGLSLDPASGVVSGTPTLQGTFNFTVTATDSAGCSGARSYTVEISACLFCDDFEDGILATGWTYVKPSWSESNGFLIGTPGGKKAIAVAAPVFSGCQACSVEAGVETAGGPSSALWIYGWFVDKKNTMELLIKQDKIILKQRINNTVVAKAKGIVTINPNVVYVMRVLYSAGQFTVSLDGNPLFTLAPAGAVPTGTVGFAVKNTTGRLAYVLVN